MSYEDADDDAYERHIDQKIDDWREEAAGLYDTDFGSDAWCRRHGRSRVPGATPGSFLYPKDCDVDAVLQMTGRLKT